MPSWIHPDPSDERQVLFQPAHAIPPSRRRTRGPPETAFNFQPNLLRSTGLDVQASFALDECRFLAAGPLGRETSAPRTACLALERLRTRPEALGVRLEGKPNPKDSVSQHSHSPWASSASGTHSWRSTDHTGWMVVPVMVSKEPSAPSTSTLATTWTSCVTNWAVTTEPSPSAIGGQSSMAVTKAEKTRGLSPSFCAGTVPEFLCFARKP